MGSFASVPLCYNKLTYIMSKKTDTILLASDHAGFSLKNTLRDFLKEKGYEVEDMGAHELVEGDDYPEIMVPVAIRVSEKPEKIRAIILGGSGQGEAMTANRFPGVRATVYYGGNLDIVKLGREHNDSNILSLGARFVNEAEAKEAVVLWLETAFSEDERHIRRIEMLDAIM